MYWQSLMKTAMKVGRMVKITQLHGIIQYDGGRAFYTGGGHTAESFSEPLFLQHIAGGIQYAMGPDSLKLDYSKAYALKAPEENRFTKVVLSNDLNEPMEIAVTPSNYVYIS